MRSFLSLAAAALAAAIFAPAGTSSAKAQTFEIVADEFLQIVDNDKYTTAKAVNDGRCSSRQYRVVIQLDDDSLWPTATLRSMSVLFGVEWKPSRLTGSTIGTAGVHTAQHRFKTGTAYQPQPAAVPMVRDREAYHWEIRPPFQYRWQGQPMEVYAHLQLTEVAPLKRYHVLYTLAGRPVGTDNWYICTHWQESVAPRQVERQRVSDEQQGPAREPFGGGNDR